MRTTTQLKLIALGSMALAARASTDAFLNFVDGRMLQATGQ